MSLYKRGGVYWSYIWLHNVRHGRSLKTSSKREAVLREIEFRQELDLRRHKQTKLNPEKPFCELATKFLGSSGATTYHSERMNKLLPFFGATPLCDLTKSLSEEFRLGRKTRDKVKDATVNHDLGVLRHILFWAVDEGILLLNPLSRVKMIHSRRIRQPVLSLEEEPRLIAAAASHLKPLIVAALDTGMRRGELFNQIAEDVDLVRKVLHVTKSKTAGGQQREIPLTARMIQLFATPPKTGLLFLYHDDPIEKLRRSWMTAVTNSGIRPLLFKHLRHTFNTRLMEAGVIQDVRMALMGHSPGRARTTNDIYTHVEMHVLRQAIQKLELWIAAQQPEAARAKESADFESEDECVLLGHS